MATRRLAAIFVLLATLMAPCAVQAHAFIDHSNPAVGSTLPTAPKVVHIWFTQELEPAFSWIQVTDKTGAAVSNGPSAIDPTNNQEMDIKLKSLPAGTYTVKWHALSVDTHTTQGDFTFQVKGG
ncbi:MAG TPA: copper resistance CopC family protein [Candidatus Dormibacteraeota bacterium]|nr:copper resistance CopC family protein [Candidatus Dormibacteraeota bacterium]